MATRAREHARYASDVLHGIREREEQLRELSPEEQLEAAVTGRIKRYNEDAQFAVQVALAHALVSVALTLDLHEAQAAR